jgi:thioredoxin 1
VHPIADAADFDARVLRSQGPVLVEFWADWCEPCRRVAPIVGEVADELAGGLAVVSVDAEAHPDLAQRYHAFGLPTLALFAGGIERARLIGAHAKRRILAEVSPFVA